MLRRLLLLCILGRAVVFLLHAFLPISSPHIWRQVTTLGVSMRYWSRWTLEEGASFLFLPAVLESGTTQGIMPMELPLLAAAAAPAFALGPEWGRVAAHLILLLMVGSLIYLNARVWRGANIASVPAFEAILLVPVFSFAAPFLTKFMPDLMAMLLVLLACGLSWRQQRPWRSFAVGCLGLLMKPTAVIVLGLWLVHGERGERPRVWLKISKWVLPALAVTFAYYTLGLHYIDSLRETKPLIMVGARPMLWALSKFFSSPSLFTMLWYHPLFPGGAVFILCLYLFYRHRQMARKALPLWLLGAFQIFLIGLLDGDHAFEHVYYFIGATPVFALIFVQTWQQTPYTIVRFLLGALLVGRLIEISVNDLQGYYKKDGMAAHFKACEELRTRNPDLPWGQGLPFRSTPESYPLLGLCFGERQDAKTGEWGIFYAEQAIPEGCKVMDANALVAVGKCEN